MKILNKHKQPFDPAHDKVNTPLKTKVFVGISGGVDSSVSTALLKEEGYDVTGVFIKAWYPDFLNCDWKEEKRDAMRICAKLDIPFIMLDLSKEYKEEVIDYLIKEYKTGNTPNPDVMCNKEIKFGSFFDWSIKQGADFIATGHYAQVKKKGNKFELYESTDTEKDQTYFLWNIKQKHLKYTLFPIGKYKKTKVRELAHKYNLFTENKKDSQGLCFLGQLDMKSFLKQYIKVAEGNVVNEKGEIIGHHDGALFYTLGERHGFTISKKSPEDEALYVIEKNIEDNTLTVSKNKPTTSAHSNEITLKEVNLISDEINFNNNVEVRMRYRQDLQKGYLTVNNDVGKIVFSAPVEYVAPGQSVVFYNKGICLGGGVVVK